MFGLSTPYRLTIRNTARLFHYVLIHIGDLHLVLPAMNLSILDAGILIMVQQVRLMMFTFNMVFYPMSFLSLSTGGQVEGTIPRCSFSLSFAV